ncbi:hypothetical protein PVNG_01542 [Plasmodium vivax North Korean]|uniref:Variable surface protein Vir35 n=1 Tax=Plasmodium vivax North Korean TaxID=1035514 RepID=A0A0J9U5H6_PLAVI|nr:hypothetical protein PVNG_01542 [Plasmodium vivax North Korean]
MELFGNYNFRESVKFVVLLKFFTYIYLIWNPNNDMVNHHAEEMKFKLGRNLNIRFNRLLAKYMPKNDLHKTHVRQNYVDYGMNKNIKNEAEKKSTYSQVKGDSLNKLDAYKKGYNHRYSKKKGLAKFECYCEKKVFDKIEYINCLGERKKSGKKSFKKTILNKYTIRFFLFALLPFLGLIIRILFGKGIGDDNYFNVYFGDCEAPKDPIRDKSCKNNFNHISSDASWAILCLNYIISYAFLAVSIVLIIYTFIKIIKYEKLKAGKGKMSAKENVSFCKNVFLGK